MDQLMTVQEVADYLKVSRTTVWRWCSDGRLPACKVGRGWRVRRKDLERFVSLSALEVREVADLALEIDQA
ncbi:MAG: helix-turn-helix domain-containing protein [Chloroflexi bacterium]|nr:helix-turn-helix domain-containing protein [Chloroflexota bacterium]